MLTKWGGAPRCCLRERGLKKPATFRSPRITVKNHFLKVCKELGKVTEFGTSRPLYSWRNGHMKKVLPPSLLGLKPNFLLYHKKEHCHSIDPYLLPSTFFLYLRHVFCSESFRHIDRIRIRDDFKKT